MDGQKALILDSLEEFESKILDFDEQVRKKENHRTLVHILFRLVHNLKGAFSMAALEDSVALLHACESCLDVLRSVDALPTERFSDLLVSTVDALRRDIVAGDIVAGDEGGPGTGRNSELRKELEREAAALSSSTSAQRGIDFALDEAELLRLERGVGAGASLYILEKLVGGDMDEESVAGLPVFDTIAEAGALIATRIRRQKGSSESEAVLVLLFATALGLEELKFLVFDPLFPITREGAGMSRKPQASVRAGGHKEGEGDHSESEAVPSSSLPRILIVDDEALPLVLLQKALVDFGRIDAASGGREALERFSAALGNAPYSVVFLDVKLGDMDGVEVLREMRRLERAQGIAEGKGVRIVMSSALHDFETISASFRDQCELYLVKPVDGAKVREAMAKLGKTPIPS